ncbi:MAG: hypothetical protein R3181_14915 [Rubricoccaceae bacterium]|nr:hypothetical protein [Rubricoccaceae bacterium]
MDTQQALVVTDAPGGLDALNDHLRQGWRVVSVAPMGGGGQTDGFAALVVIERAGPAVEAVLEQLAEEVEEVLEGDGAPDESAEVLPVRPPGERLRG